MCTDAGCRVNDERIWREQGRKYGLERCRLALNAAVPVLEDEVIGLGEVVVELESIAGAGHWRVRPLARVAVNITPLCLLAPDHALAAHQCPTKRASMRV